MEIHYKADQAASFRLPLLTTEPVHYQKGVW
nr:MAG TPA: hypothetical protein [Caudoviricetes sp.]